MFLLNVYYHQFDLGGIVDNRWVFYLPLMMVIMMIVGLARWCVRKMEKDVPIGEYEPGSCEPATDVYGNTVLIRRFTKRIKRFAPVKRYNNHTMKIVSRLLASGFIFMVIAESHVGMFQLILNHFWLEPGFGLILLVLGLFALFRMVELSGYRVALLCAALSKKRAERVIKERAKARARKLLTQKAARRRCVRRVRRKVIGPRRTNDKGLAGRRPAYR